MKSYVRYAIAVVALLIVIIILVLGFNFIRNLFSNDKPEQSKTDTKQTINLIEAGKAGEPVRYTVRGVINGNEQHRSIRITIDDTTRKIEILQGFNNEVLKTQESTNTREAYDAFIPAINGAGFTNTIPPEGRGIESQSCPLGRGFSYEVKPGSNDAFRSWAVSCNSKQGTFSGNNRNIQQLFQLQIPDYSKFIEGVRLS